MADFDDPIGIEEDDGTRALTDHQYISQHIANFRPLSPVEERLLATAASRGDVYAGEMLLHHTTPLVLYHASRFRPSNTAFVAGGLEYSDLVQEGLIALGRAIEHWNPEYGKSFNSYASEAVVNQMSRALTEMEDSIRLPRDMHRLGREINAINVARQADHQPLATPEELAELLGTTAERVRLAQNPPRARTSIDQPVGEDGTTPLIDLLPDRDAEDFTTRIDDIEASPQEVHTALARLKPREREILTKRYLEGKDMKQTASELSLSTERVRVQERRALGKLRRALGMTGHAAKAQQSTALAPQTNAMRGMSL